VHDLSRCGYTDDGHAPSVKGRLVGYRADRRHAGL